MQLHDTPDPAALVALLAVSGLPVDDLAPGHRVRFLAAGPSAAPEGVVGLELFGEVGLLRSLAVAVPARGRGLGAALVAAAEAAAREAGAGQLYLLTTTAADFFAARGYAPARREDAPEAILTHPQFTGLCPASAALLMKRLQAV
jgi:amino-acid N-acetyltransferase